MKKGFAFLGTLSGIAAIVLAIVIFSYGTGYTERDVTYGGDAYTGIQNAAAQSANNVKYLAELVQFGTFSLLLTVGLISICYFAPKCVEKDEPKAAAPAPVPERAAAPAAEPVKEVKAAEEAVKEAAAEAVKEAVPPANAE